MNQLARLVLLVMTGLVVFLEVILTIMTLVDGGRVTYSLVAFWLIGVAMIAALMAGLRKLAAAKIAGEQRAQQEVQLAVRTTQRLEADARWFFQGSLFALIFLILGAATWLTWVQGKPVVSILFAVAFTFFSAFALDMAHQVLRPGPMLVLDARGIQHAMYGLMPWGEVIGLALRRRHVNGTTIGILHVGVRRPDRYLINASLLKRWSKRKLLRETPRFGALEIPLNPLNKSAELIHETAQALRTRVSPPALTFWYPEMEPAQVETILDMDRMDRELRALGPDPTPSQVADHAQSVKELQPRIEAAAQIAAEHAQRLSRKNSLLTAGMVIFVLAWIYMKFAQ